MAIKTRNRGKFLKHEFKLMNFDNYDEFVRLMQGDIKKCPSCTLLYWEGTRKRCKCDE